MKFTFFVTVTLTYVNDLPCILYIFQIKTNEKSSNKGTICIYQFYSFDHISGSYHKILNFQEWFDEEIAYEVKNREKLLKKFKKSKVHIDEDIYNAARCKFQKTSFDEEKPFLKSNCIGKPEDRWKTFKYLGLPNISSSGEVSAFKINNIVKC